MTYIYAYIGSGAAFLLLDLLWLGLIAQGFYQRQMGGLMAESFNILAAIVFYAIYLLGILIFAVSPALESGGLLNALLTGGAFGFFCYATYNLTNLAVMRNYPAKLAVVDIVWGTILTAVASGAGFFAATSL